MPRRRKRHLRHQSTCLTTNILAPIIILKTTQALLDSIPATHRPQIDATTAGTKISLTFRGGSLESLGSVLFPVVFTTSTNQKVQLILYALVIPEFQIPMFISRDSLAASLNGFSEVWRGGPTYTLDFGNEKIDVKGM